MFAAASLKLAANKSQSALARAVVTLTKDSNCVLTSLDLSGCPKLTALPEAATNWTQLTSLNLSNCRRLTALPEGAANWTQLTSLNLSDCYELTALPEGAANWTQLTTLNLS